jgi:hypothetical protein
LAARDAVADPLCGTLTYDGHSGTDLRILSKGIWKLDMQSSLLATEQSFGYVTKSKII